MLTSKVWRHRLAKKSSALGIASTLVLFVGAILTASPAHAADATTTCTVSTGETGTLVVPIGTGTGTPPTKTIKFTCPSETTGAITNATLDVEMTASVASAPASGTFNVAVKVPALTLRTSPTVAGTMKVSQAMTVTGGTMSDSTDKVGGAITVGSIAVPMATVTYPVQVTGTAGSNVTVTPGSLKLTVGTGTGTGDDVIPYDCSISGTDADYPADVDMKVTMTMPTAAKANEDASITWTGVVQTTGDPLKVPAAANLPTGSKFFVTIKASGAGAPTTATGEAILSTTTAGSTITPPSVTIKLKPTTTGTVTVTPGEIAIGGTTASGATIKCLVATGTTPKTSTFTVSAATSTTSPTATTTPKPTTTRTVVVTKTPVGPKPSGKVTKTPKAGAETGGGGDMGPDGRTFILVGSLLIMAAGAGGLFLRRRTAQR